MSDIVLRAEDLGKKYVIGHQAGRERYTALRDALASATKGLVRAARDMVRGRQLLPGDELEEFWALKDVSFEIKRGEVVGIIGRNGAGKSTLLKILSRITEPSAGRVEIKGRVASLLEVGTGFHPELTGRENIYLNGAILGMTHAEISRKFDEIVAFAEIEKFLDTPVKRYSSGMYVRLAFAVAAHLEPEILVVDEVLAVGDAEFQRKCLGKMQDVAEGGRTVLFVSHNMAAVQALCITGILLNQGRVHEVGDASRVVQSYMVKAKRPASFTENRSASGDVKLISAYTCDACGVKKDVFASDEPVVVVMDVAVACIRKRFRVGLRVIHSELDTIFTSGDTDRLNATERAQGVYRLSCIIPANLLRPDEYSIALAADVPMVEVLYDIPEALFFSILPSGTAGGHVPDNRRGVIRPLLEWRQSNCNTYHLNGSDVRQ